jgi:hypothetical protein
MKKIKDFFNDKGNKDTLLTAWWFIKYVMFTAFIVNYFNILYGGYAWLLFVVLASICNAVMDVISFHYDKSIFSKYNKNFFNPQFSWMNKYKKMGDKTIDLDKRRKFFWFINFPVQFTDLFHLSKTFMIIFLGLSAVFYTNKNEWYFDLFLFGYFWNITFSIFYNKILR